MSRLSGPAIDLCVLHVEHIAMVLLGRKTVRRSIVVLGSVRAGPLVMERNRKHWGIYREGGEVG